MIFLQRIFREQAPARRQVNARWSQVLHSLGLALMTATLIACGGGSGGGDTGDGSGGEIPGGSGSSGGAGGGGSSGGSVPDAAINSQEAFAQTVYPLIREEGGGEAKCYRCHSEKSEGILPNFAHRDVAIAYKELVESQKVNLGSPERSRIVQRLAGDNHNCWTGITPDACAADAQKMQAAVESWVALIADSEAEQIPVIASGTASMAGANGGPITLSFDISNAVQAPASIQLEASVLDDFSYLFGAPTFTGPAGSNLRVKDVRIGVNETIPVAAQAFRDLDVIVTGATQELSRQGAAIPREAGPEEDVFFLAFEILGDMQVAIPEPGPRVSTVREPEAPSYGLRLFSQVNDTFAAVTGVDAQTPAVLATFNAVKTQLPVEADPRTFVTGNQMAVQRLAVEYCIALVDSPVLRDQFFGQFPGIIDNQIDKVIIAGQLYNNILGNNLASQPVRDGVVNEILGLMLDLGCADNCDAALTETVTKASCTAVLANAGTMVN